MNCPTCSGVIDAQTGICPNCATQIQAAVAPEIPGFRIIKPLGQGGMGAVYLAEETALGRRVAIKVMSARLSAEVQAKSRFLREARSMATVEHPHVVRIYSYGEIRGNAYLVMEYVEGETLTDRIARGPLPLPEALQITREVVEALEAAWERNIIHRDIKPSNVLLDRRGRVRVADFGLAKPVHLDRRADTSLTQSGYMLGSPHYVSPEQAQGKDLDFRADLYSLGIMLYQMLTGERPFDGTTPVAIVAKHLHEPMPSLRTKRPDVPVEIERAIQWLTAKEPEARPDSYAKVAAALGGVEPTLRSLPFHAPTTAKWWQADLSTMPMRTRVSLVAAALVAGLIFFLALAIIGSRHARFSPPAAARDTRLVVAIAPFYGPDDDSAKEGRVMAALIERAIQQRLGSANARVIGIDETKSAVRDHDAARALGTRLKANAVIWGEAFALRNETEIEPHLTVIRAQAQQQAATPQDHDERLLAAGLDPLRRLEERGGGAVKLEAEAPNQIELRKTSASGIGDLVMTLAAIHALDTERKPAKALDLFRQVPKSTETLRYEAKALLDLGSNSEAQAKLEESLALEPDHAATLSTLGDLYLTANRPADAVAVYVRADASGQPYASSRGFVQQGRLYAVETYRSQRYMTGGERKTVYLLELDPATRKVLRRFTLPGIPSRFERAGDAVKITYFTRGEQDGDRGTLTVRNGAFDKPLWPPLNLSLRVQSMRAGQRLAANFLPSGVRDPKVESRFALGNEIQDDAPKTLPELEQALRAAAENDPTQPWHLFLLALTLDAEGRRQESAAVMRAMIGREYPGSHYYEFTWMMNIAERMRRQDWTDRILPKALAYRRRLAQPAIGALLIERLINASFVRQAAMNRDMRYGYRRLLEARQLTGPSLEAEDLAAAAWARYFDSMGDRQRADSERAIIRQINASGMNYLGRTTLTDYALSWTAASLLAFAVMLIAGIARAIRRARRSERRPVWSRAAALLRRVPGGRAVGIGIASGMALAIGYVWVLDLWKSEVAFLAIVLLLIGAVARGSRVRIVDLIAALQKRERWLIVFTYASAAVGVLAMSTAVAQVGRLAATPIGWSDSIGHITILSDFEKRLSERPGSRSLIFATAVANHDAGETSRARELYNRIGADERAQRNLAALDRGMPPPAGLTLEDLRDAYLADSLAQRLRHLISNLDKGVDEDAVGTVLMLLMAILISTIPLVLMLAIRPDPTLVEPVRTSEDSTIVRLLMLAIPGLYDARRGSLWRTAVIVFGLGALIMPVVMQLKYRGALPAPGPLTAMATPNYANAFPLPPGDARAAFRMAFPHARLFYSLVGVSAALALILHLSRFPTILRRRGAVPNLVTAPET